MSGNLLGALSHVFLPKRTPGSEQSNLSSIEAYILEAMNQAVSKSFEEKFNLLELHEIGRMFQAWTSIQPWTSFDMNLVQTFANLIKDESYKTIPIYVKSQNCTVIFERENDKVRMETYRSSLPTQVVMENIHDLIMTFPETSKIVRNVDFLKSKVFAKAILELSTEAFGVPSPSPVTEPFLVNDFLSGLLCAGIKLEGDDNFCKISKKLRDQVTFNPGANPQVDPPFRRSGIWLSIKVVLQLKLCRLIKNEKASRVLYKLLILRTVTEFCERYYELREETQIDLDLMAQILANIGQRVCKLQDLYRAIDEEILEDEERGVVFDQIEEFKEATFEMVYGVVDKVKDFMNLCIFKNEDPIKLAPRSIEAYLEDLDHQIIFSEADIHKSLAEIEREARRFKGKSSNAACKDLARSKELQRYSTATSILSGWSTASKTADKQRVWLHDTETYLKTDLKSKSDSGTLLKVACEYLEHAVKVYQDQNDNPLGISQIFLCLLKVLEELDRRAVSRHSLLLNYKSGVKPEYFHNLILPHKEDFDLLDRALSYFQSRDDVATQKETIFPEKITPKSLSVQFVEENETFRERLKMINAKVEEHINHKIKTVQNVREDCKTIKDCLSKEPRCECGMNCDCWRSYLEKDLEKKKESVLIYEKPLPVEDHLQKAVLFELYIPSEISILRDALLILQKGLLKDPDFLFLLETSEELHVNWGKYANYRGYLDKPIHCPSQFVSFGSKLRSNGQIILSRKNPNVLSASGKDFINENGLQLQYSFSFMELKVTNRPTFKIQSMASWDSYGTLQRYLESWKHSQNEVICNQNDCHVDLSLEEFIAYGSLRAGHRIQLRNLYRALASNFLSLSEEPVLALLLQTVWQMGPRSGVNGKWEAHEDFTDNGEFCLEFLSLLEKIVKDNENNYANPCTLIGAVVIAVRIMEQNIVALKKGKELLREWRALMRTWRGKIEKTIKKEEEYAAAKMNMEENIEDLKKNLLLINVSSALSYNLSKDTIWEMFRNGDEDMIGWFHTVSYFNLMESYVGGLSGFMRLLHGLGRDVALRLKVEERDISTSFVFKCVKRFVVEKWRKAGECHEPVIIEGNPQKNLLELRYEVQGMEGERSEVKMEVESEEDFEMVEKEELEEPRPGQNFHMITFDFVLGTFLVNGYPAGHLPAEVTKNPTFIHFFGESNTKLVVQQESECVFRTNEKFHGNDYEFYLARGRTWTKTKISVVLIKQVQNKDEMRILLEPSELEGDLQDTFVQDYTHWLHEDTGIIDFKRKCKQDSDYDRKVEYRLIRNEPKDDAFNLDEVDSDVWKFFDVGNNAYLLSIKSDGFRNLTKFLFRLELKQFMNVLVDKEALENVTVHLPRYNLRFKVRLDMNCLESVEYPGYFMTGEVETSTLVGLQQGIQLRKGEKRMLLLPNGDVHLEKGAYHHNTLISLDNLRQPAYFKYEYDEVLRRLVGNNSKVPYLYLAALHAMTSLTSGQPDPFTGVTGTEMAIRILQSGFIWSSSPYDEDCLRILKVIKELSPERRSFEEGEDEKKSSGGEYLTVEVIEWMKILPSLSAHDAFELIVWKLKRDSEKLKILHLCGRDEDEVKGKEGVSEAPSFLRARAYFKYLSYYNSSAKLELSNVDRSPLEKLNKPISVISNGADRFFLTQLCSIAYARHITSSQFLNLFEPEVLVSYLHSSPFQSKPIVWNTPNWTSSPRLVFNNTGLRENWFWLYKMASKKEKTSEEVQTLTLLLSVFAYNGAPLKQILNLHYLSVNADQLELPEVPGSMPRQTQSISVDDPSKDEIRNFFHGIVNRHWHHNKSYAYMHSGIGRKCYDQVMTYLTENWLNLSIQIPTYIRDASFVIYNSVSNYCDSDKVMKEARAKITQWHFEKQFRDFVKTIQAKLQLIQEQSQRPKIFTILISQSVSPQIEKNDDTAKYGGGARLVDFGKHLYSFLNRISLDEDVLNKARCIFNGEENAIDEFQIDFEAQRSRLIETAEEILKVLLNENSDKFDGKILHSTSIYPRTDPTTLLQILLQIKRYLTATDEKTKAVCSHIGALAVLWTKTKRLYRCIAFQSAGQDTELQRELQNKPHENWYPSERPEWLCLELELDIIIRSKQVEVSNQMHKMPNKGNGVMQLNMGEGKTSVIVPMLCCVLGGKDKLCRVTILASMLNMNYKILSFAIGGIINKRIYMMPCRRDMEIDLETVKTVQGSYEECLKLQGVVLALAEHRLSFRLLAYDKLLKEKTQLGLKLWETENWLQRKVRNVLDESDELLNAKYQLVYTVGGKIELDGGNLRWSCCQTLLHILKETSVHARSAFN